MLSLINYSTIHIIYSFFLVVCSHLVICSHSWLHFVMRHKTIAQFWFKNHNFHFFVNITNFTKLAATNQSADWSIDDQSEPNFNSIDLIELNYVFYARFENILLFGDRLLFLWKTKKNKQTIPVFELISCKISGLRVTIPDPLGRKSLQTKKAQSFPFLRENTLWHTKRRGQYCCWPQALCESPQTTKRQNSILKQTHCKQTNKQNVPSNEVLQHGTLACRLSAHNGNLWQI